MDFKFKFEIGEFCFVQFDNLGWDKRTAACTIKVLRL
jgi:hypothetical protein